MNINVKQLRTWLNLTQKEFAKKLDVNVLTVSRWETNPQRKPQPVYIRKMKRMQQYEEFSRMAVYAFAKIDGTQLDGIKELVNKYREKE